MLFLIFSEMFGIFSAAGVEFPRSNAPGNNDKIVICSLLQNKIRQFFLHLISILIFSSGISPTPALIWTASWPVL